MKHMGTTVEISYETLILDPDSESRMRLKQAVVAVPAFKTVHQLSSVRDALPKLAQVDGCDIIFVSSLLSKEDTIQFIADAKSTDQCQDAAFVLVLKTKDQGSSTIATGVMGGVDGFLCEPYSVDALTEITQLARRVRGERQAARQRKAVGVMLNDIIPDIDRAAILAACNVDASGILRRIRAKCTPFYTFDNESKAMYFDLAVNVFQSTPISVEYERNKHMRVSSRLRKKLEEEERMRAEQDKTSGSSPRVITRRR